MGSAAGLGAGHAGCAVTTPDQAAGQLREALTSLGDAGFAEAVQRYFPHRVAALGVSNAAVAGLAREYFRAHAFSPAERLEIAELVLERARHHEEVVLGFAVVQQVVRRNFDAALLDRFRRWLETFVTNWAQCDDLCLKAIYPFFLGHPQLITSTQSWLDSSSPWARRAANVSMVKFVRRAIGGEVYELPLEVVFRNALRLIDDPEPYVQKSVGWLLKAAANEHPQEVAGFLRRNGHGMKRETLRIAIEKLEPSLRRSLLAGAFR